MDTTGLYFKCKLSPNSNLSKLSHNKGTAFVPESQSGLLLRPAHMVTSWSRHISVSALQDSGAWSLVTPLTLTASVTL